MQLPHGSYLGGGGGGGGGGGEVVMVVVVAYDSDNMVDGMDSVHGWWHFIRGGHRIFELLLAPA